MALKCTNTSSPPSWVMKPYPFASLNHLTVPLAMTRPLSERGSRPVKPRHHGGGPPELWRKSKNAAGAEVPAALISKLATSCPQPVVTPNDHAPNEPTFNGTYHSRITVPAQANNLVGPEAPVLLVAVRDPAP